MNKTVNVRVKILLSHFRVTIATEEKQELLRILGVCLYVCVAVLYCHL
jgi:hypothetical protein